MGSYMAWNGLCFKVNRILRHLKGGGLTQNWETMTFENLTTFVLE